MIDRAETTARILAAKAAAGLTFAEIAAKVGAHEVWVTSALLGQNTMTPEQAAQAGEASTRSSRSTAPP